MNIHRIGHFLKIKSCDKILSLENNKYKNILRYVSDGVIITNKEGIIMYMNEAGLKKLGLSIENVVSKKYQEVISIVNQSGTTIDKSNMPTPMVFATGKELIVTYRYVTANNGNFGASIIALPININGRVEEVIEIFKDISKEKEVYDLRTEFIGLASHELKTPLASIGWFSEILMDNSENLTTEQKEFIENIHNSNQRMVEIVTTFLDSSWMESGKPIKVTDVNVKTLIDEIMIEINHKIKNKNQTFNINIDPLIKDFKSDSKLLREVYVNLLTNANKYTPNDGKIDLNIYRNGTTLVSEVIDNGYGVPEDEKNKIFQKFFRAKNALEHETEGTGLGLYISSFIVKKLGGKLWFESEEGKGTKFAFNIPLS